MSAGTLDELVPRGRVGLLAHIAGFGPGECAAIRRHAEREESRQEWLAAAETFQVAAMIEPGEPACWEGLARCLSKLGDEARARHAFRVADRMREVFR
jgi:hypothetical protein